MDRARAERYGRAASRWARLLTGGRARPGLRVFYGWDRVPGPGEQVAGGTAKLAEARRPLAEPPDRLLAPLPRHDLPAARPAARSSGSRAGAGEDRRQPGRCRVPGLGGRAHRRAERAAPARRPRRRPRRLPERVQQALVRSHSSASRADRGRSSRTRSTWSDSRPARRPPDGPVVLLGGDQTQAYRLELALETFRHVLAAHPDARLLVSGRLVSDPIGDPAAPRPRDGGRLHRAATRRSRRPSVFRRAHVLLHTKVNDPCPTAVIEAMACGVPVAYAASGGTVELVGDEAGVGVPHPGRLRARRAAVSRRRSPPPSRRSSPTASASPQGPAARAVERFALTRLARPPRRDLRLPRRVARLRSGAPRRAKAARGGRDSVAAWNRARVVSSSASETSAPTAGRTSIRATVRAGYPFRART